jgi:ferredoxin
MGSVGKHVVTVFPGRIVDFLATCLSFVTKGCCPLWNLLAVNSKMSRAIEWNERERHACQCALEAELTTFVSQ